MSKLLIMNFTLFHITEMDSKFGKNHPNTLREIKELMNLLAAQS